jgi:DNA-binding transcriptional LysR family regulator
MLPLLRQCHDSAQSARALAALINDGAAGALKVAVSGSIELGLILDAVNALRRAFSELELKILRGSGPQLVEYLKAGDAELAVAASIGDWDRLDSWTLFDEPFDMVFSRGHRLAGRESIARADLAGERFLLRSHCEKDAELAALLRANGLDADKRHEVSSDQDLLALLEAGIGIGFLPRSVDARGLVRAAPPGFALGRTVCLYGVAGRQRSPVAATFMKMLRAAQWPAHAG